MVPTPTSLLPHAQQSHTANLHHLCPEVSFPSLIHDAVTKRSKCTCQGEKHFTPLDGDGCRPVKPCMLAGTCPSPFPLALHIYTYTGRMKGITFAFVQGEEKWGGVILFWMIYIQIHSNLVNLPLTTFVSQTHRVLKTTDNQ